MMLWIVQLDTKAQRWPTPIYWCYLALKWSLVFVGAFGLAFAWAQNDHLQWMLRSLRW